MLVYPRIHSLPRFSAGRPRERFVDSITLNEDKPRERVHSERVAMQEPDNEGSPNNGGRMYNSSDILRSDYAATAVSNVDLVLKEACRRFSADQIWGLFGKDLGQMPDRLL